MEKKLLFLICVLGIFGPLKAMDPLAIKQIIQEKSWIELAGRIRIGEINTKDLEIYTKADFSGEDMGDTLCERLIAEAGFEIQPQRNGSEVNWQHTEKSTRLWNTLEHLVAMDKLVFPDDIEKCLGTMSHDRAQICRHICKEIDIRDNLSPQVSTDSHVPQSTSKTFFTLGGRTYIIGVALVAVAGLVAYKYWSAPSQDEDGETETEKHEAVEPVNT